LPALHDYVTWMSSKLGSVRALHFLKQALPKAAHGMGLTAAKHLSLEKYLSLVQSIIVGKDSSRRSRKVGCC